MVALETDGLSFVALDAEERRASEEVSFDEELSQIGCCCCCLVGDRSWSTLTPLR